MEENENLLLEVDGVYRRLIIPETTVKDSAEYVCDTGDDSMTFFVNIAGKKHQKVRKKNDSLDLKLTSDFPDTQNLPFASFVHERQPVRWRK